MRARKRPGAVLLPAGVDQYEAMCDMVAEHADPGTVVLDVGAGDGDREYPTRLKKVVARVVGLDPSPGIHLNERVDERVQATLEDFAASHAGSFDVAVLSYVVEHVARPVEFLAALRHCLRPGGSAFVLTPHLFHYFGTAAFLARRLRIDERLLHRIRDEETLHDHHFPVHYRMNSRGRLIRCARRAGFAAVEFRMVDQPGIYQPYFPQWLQGVPVAWSRMVHGLGMPALAGTMLARLQA